MAKRRGEDGDALCFFKFPQGLVGHPAMTGPCYAFVVAFLTRAREPGQQCWADVATLGKIVGKGKSAAYEARDTLMKAGLLIQESRRDKPEETAYRLAPVCWRPYNKPGDRPSSVRKSGNASPEIRKRQSGNPETPVRKSGTDRETSEKDSPEAISSSSWGCSEGDGTETDAGDDQAARVAAEAVAVFVPPGAPGDDRPDTSEADHIRQQTVMEEAWGLAREFGPVWTILAIEETGKRMQAGKSKTLGYTYAILKKWRNAGGPSLSGWSDPPASKKHITRRTEAISEMLRREFGPGKEALPPKSHLTRQKEAFAAMVDRIYGTEKEPNDGRESEGRS